MNITLVKKGKYHQALMLERDGNATREVFLPRHSSPGRAANTAVVEAGNVIRAALLAGGIVHISVTGVETATADPDNFGPDKKGEG